MAMDCHVREVLLQSEVEGLKRRVDRLDEELQLSRRSATERQQEKEDLRAALRESQAEAEALRADVGRSKFRLGDLQQAVTQLQVQDCCLGDTTPAISICSSV